MPVSLVLYIIATACFVLLALGVAVGSALLLPWGLAFLAAGKVSEKTRLG